MKNTIAVNIAAPFEPWALSVVRTQPGFDAAVRADAEIRVEGRTRPIVVEAKRRVDSVTAHAVVALAHVTPAGRDFILVAGTTSAGAREVLEANGVAYLDGLGNASIRLAGVFIRTRSVGAAPSIAGREPMKARLTGKGGLVAQALLLHPDRSWGVAELAVEAGVSRGLAHRVLARLESANILVADGVGPRKVRRVTNPAALLDLWAEEDKEPGTLLTAAYVLVRPGTRAAELISERLAEAGIAHAITGNAAAAMLAPALTSVSVARVRVTAAIPAGDVLKAIGARQVEEGANLVIAQGSGDAELRFCRQAGGILVGREHPDLPGCPPGSAAWQGTGAGLPRVGPGLLMMTELGDYDTNLTHLCERMLVTVIGNAGFWGRRLYLVGGLVPRYLCGSIPDGAPAHVGSRDVDLAVVLLVDDPTSKS